MDNTNLNYYIRADINWTKKPIALNRRVFIRIDATLFDIGKSIKLSLGCKDKKPFYFEDLNRVYPSTLFKNRRQYCLSKQKMLKNSKSSYLDQLDYLPNSKLYFNLDIGTVNTFEIIFYPEIVEIENDKILIIETGSSIGMFEYNKKIIDDEYKQHLYELNDIDLEHFNSVISSSKISSHNDSNRLIKQLDNYMDKDADYIATRELNRTLYENAFRGKSHETVGQIIKSVASSSTSTPIEIMRFNIFISELEDHQNISVIKDYYDQLQLDVQSKGFLKHPCDPFKDENLCQFYGASYLYINLLRKTGNHNLALKIAYILYKLDPKDRFDLKHVVDAISCNVELENYIFNDLNFYKTDPIHIGNIALQQINNRKYNLALENCSTINNRNKKFGYLLLYGNFINTKTLSDLEVLIGNDDLAEASYFVSLHNDDFTDNSPFDRFVYENSEKLSKQYSLSDLEVQVFLALLVGHEHVYSIKPDSRKPTTSIEFANNYIEDGDNVIDLKEPFKENQQLMGLLGILIQRKLLHSYCGKYQISDEGLALMPYYRKTIPEAFKILDKLPPASSMYNE